MHRCRYGRAGIGTIPLSWRYFDCIFREEYLGGVSDRECGSTIGGSGSGCQVIEMAAVGERVDDFVNMPTHLAVLSAATPSRSSTIDAYGSTLIGGFGHHTNNLQKPRTRVPAVLLGDATGPFRIPEDDWPDATEHRISIVETWLGTVA